MKYKPEKIQDPRNAHEKKHFGHTKARWHNDTGPTRPMMAQSLRNFPQSIYIFKKKLNIKEVRDSNT